jgi:hypothetical protein
MGRSRWRPPALRIAAPDDLPPIDELHVEEHPVRCRRGDVCHPSHDWPLRAAEARAASPASTLGECIAATLRDAQARLRFVPRHNFEVFRLRSPRVKRRRKPAARLKLGERGTCVRACPSAHKPAKGKVLYASVGEDASGHWSLALCRSDSRDVAEMWLCQLEVVRIADRMVALVPLAAGELPRAVIEHDVKIMGILAFDDNKAMDDFLALLVAAGLAPTDSNDNEELDDEPDLTPSQGRRLREFCHRQSTRSARSAFQAWSTGAWSTH